MLAHASLPEQINKCEDLIQTVPLYISLHFFLSFHLSKNIPVLERKTNNTW